MVDGEMENEHVTGGETGDGVGDTGKDSQFGGTAIVSVSPLSMSGTYEFHWF